MFRFSFCFALAILIFCLAGNAQQVTGTLVGNVVDPQGAAVAGARVTVTNAETNQEHSTVCNGHGEYRVEFLPPGIYAIKVEDSGFQTFIRAGVRLQVGQFARVDAKLELGATTSTVRVEGAAPAVNTTEASVGQTLGSQEITTLPLVNRDVYALLPLTPGVQNTTQAITLGFPAQRTFINGGADATMGSVNYYLDGGANMSSLRNTGNVLPNPDAIGELRVETNNYSAEYGRFGNGVVNAVTKSGTNQFHGSAFEFVRNTAFDANAWNALNKPPLHRNQFGGTLGGPIIRNKTFFFGSYSGLRQNTTQLLNSAVVPTPAERSGDFSTNKNPIIDPTTGSKFPGNRIPLTSFDPTALAIMNKYIPLANEPNGTFQGQVPNPYDTDEYLLKIDQDFSNSQRLTVSYFTTAGHNSLQTAGNMPWSLQSYNWRQQNASASFTSTITPSLLNQAWLNYTRYFGGRTNLPALSLHDLGSDFMPQGTPSLPQIAVSGYFTLGQSIAGPVAGDNQYAFRDLVSYMHGRHSIHFGGDISLAKDIQNTLLNNYGVFDFSGAVTGPKSNQGDGFADFLLGRPASMNQDAPETAIYNFWYGSLFVQDDFKIVPRLTLNLGLRWDVQTPPVDPQNRQQTFVPGRQSQTIPSAPLGLLVVGDPGVERGVIPPRWHHFAPRLGLAWDPFGDGKTAVRAGAGIFYGSVSGNGWGTVENSQPFAVRAKFSNIESLTHPYASFPGGVSPYPYVYSPQNARFITPIGLLPIALDFQWPLTYQFNFTVQRQIANDFSVSAGYVGTLVHHLAFSPDVNYPVYRKGATSSNYNSRRPYGNGLLSTINMMESNGTAAYHALQLKANKAMGKRFSLTAYYTFSKSLASAQMDGQSTNGGAQDANNLALERGLSDYDQRHNFVAALVWNASYYGGSSRLLQNVLNGWSLSPIITLTSGQPFTVTSGKDNNYDGVNNDRANIIGDPYLSPSRSRSAVTAEWFNTAAFVANPIGADGTSARNLLAGPGSKNVDLGIFRNFTFSERVRLQFRAEFTNFFNIVNLNAPNSTLTSKTFGQITGAGTMREMQLGARVTF
ncbi:MAG TPA: TonB-dependent receptor [Bryobacteraceae bacterium]|nr:TonB-dependent receptor [Bryobacteraceae bacterium]